MSTSTSSTSASLQSATTEAADAGLTSGVLTSPADAMLRDAIAATLAAEPMLRTAVFRQRVAEIEQFMSRQIHERPWTCRIYSGTDGSSVFRGGVGHSLVIDPSGRLWRARSYEDFVTTYVETNGIYDIDALTPIYPQMRECLGGIPEREGGCDEPRR